MKLKAFIAILLLSQLAQAQLTAEEKQSTLKSMFDILSKKYVKEEATEEIEQRLTKHYLNGRYDSLISEEDFAFSVTEDLREITQDLHLGLTYYPVENSENVVESDEKEKEEYLKMVLGSSGFGFRKKEILPGNIGYLEIPLFGPLDRVADTLVDAMHKIADTDALILDLRECRGSMDQNTVPFLLGYFFQDPVHLMDFHIRETNFIRQFWSAAWVPGKKYLNKPVYVLTSGRTFSGGEALAFLMQKQQRATIIGNITRGGSHPFQLMRLNNKFGVNVPYSTSVDPVDGGSWEGVGVNPDIFVDTKLALHEAHLLALHDLLEKNSGVERKRLADIIEKQQADKPIFKHLTFKLKAFPDAKKVIVTGSFNSWERESLFMERKGDEWILSTEVSPGRHTYNFIVDGKWILDPANPEIEKGEFENSVVWVK